MISSTKDDIHPINAMFANAPENMGLINTPASMTNVKSLFRVWLELASNFVISSRNITPATAAAKARSSFDVRNLRSRCVLIALVRLPTADHL